MKTAHIKFRSDSPRIYHVRVKMAASRYLHYGGVHPPRR
jgi:hypothetical protein